MRRILLKSRLTRPDASALPPDAEALASILAEALIEDLRQHPDRYHGGANPEPWKEAEVVEFSDYAKKKIKVPRQEGGRK